MKKHFWKLEYSITLVIIFAIVLLFLPNKIMTSREALFVTKWNDVFPRMEYVYNAMNAQADLNILQGLKKLAIQDDKELYMINLLKPYLRINENSKIKPYTMFYMNGLRASKGEEGYFRNIYNAEHGTTFGIKYLNPTDDRSPIFLMMLDVNGKKKPNIWGKDIFGIYVYSDLSLFPLGKGMEMKDVKKDCSTNGRGLSCSYYYQIGGEFNE